MSMAPEPGNVQIVLNLPADVVEELQRFADEHQTTATEVIRSAISNEIYIRRQLEDGAKILIQPRRGPLRELVFASLTTVPSRFMKR